MKTPVVLAVLFSGLIAALLVVSLAVGKMHTAGQQFVSDVQHSPFAPNPAAASSGSYRPPAEFHANLGNISVASADDFSDEKQALGRIEDELNRGSQAPVLEVKWVRVAPGTLDAEHDFTYFRDAMQVSYRIGQQAPLGCGGIKVMDILGMAHSAKAGIAENIGILTRRK